jgi:hypothetical protein
VCNTHLPRRSLRCFCHTGVGQSVEVRSIARCGVQDGAALKVSGSVSLRTGSEASAGAPSPAACAAAGLGLFFLTPPSFDQASAETIAYQLGASIDLFVAFCTFVVLKQRRRHSGLFTHACPNRSGRRSPAPDDSSGAAACAQRTRLRACDLVHSEPSVVHGVRRCAAWKEAEPPRAVREHGGRLPSGCPGGHTSNGQPVRAASVLA